jgi:hypothetical protein
MKILSQIEDVMERYPPQHHLTVAGFLGYCPVPGAFELFASNPGLGLLLAHCGKFRRGLAEPWHEARKRIKDPRRSILGWLGFPASKSSVRVVAKIDVQRISVEHCLELRDLLYQEKTACTLRHLPALCDGVIDILAKPRLRHLVTHAMLEELCYRNDDDVISSLIGQILIRAEQHRIRLRLFTDCARVEKIAEQLEEMEDRLKPEWHQHYNDIEFPAPPIPVPIYSQPPGMHIEPIRSPRELFQEATAQHNCLFVHLQKVAAGDVAIYRILKPERASVMLRRSGNESWDLTEFLAARNRPVKRETIWVVCAYLSRQEERLWKSTV